MSEHGFYKSDDQQPPAGRKSSFKKGQSKPGVKFSKVNRAQSEDAGEEDDDSCIDFEVSSDSSMSVDRPPKSIVWKDRPKSKKVSKIRTVSIVHRTTRLEPPTEDTASNIAPQANDGDTAVAVEEEQAQPELMAQDQVAQPPVPARRRQRRPWPYGSGLPGFGAYHATSWHDSDSEEHEERDKHDDPPHLVTTSYAQEDSVPITRTFKRCRETEARSGNELPKLIKDNEHRVTGKMSSDPMSSEPIWHFDMCPDLSSSDTNPAHKEPTQRRLPKVLR